MEAANKITFEIKEDGSGYGHLFATFGKSDDIKVREIGMVCHCNDENMIATVLSIIGSYTPAIVGKEKVALIVAESNMRCAEERFNTLKKKEQKNEKL